MFINICSKMKVVIFKIALLLAMLSFPFMGIFSNDTLSTFLISEGNRGLALEKLLQFKCTEEWTPSINCFCFDKRGNVYLSVGYASRLEMPDGQVQNNSNRLTCSIMKITPNYELLWYKEFEANVKNYKGSELTSRSDTITIYTFIN